MIVYFHHVVDVYCHYNFNIMIDNISDISVMVIVRKTAYKLMCQIFFSKLWVQNCTINRRLNGIQIITGQQISSLQAVFAS